MSTFSQQACSDFSCTPIILLIRETHTNKLHGNHRTKSVYLEWTKDKTSATNALDVIKLLLYQLY